MSLYSPTTPELAPMADDIEPLLLRKIAKLLYGAYSGTAPIQTNLGGTGGGGDTYLFLGMGGYRATEKLYCALSRDGLNWYVANNGASVYTAATGGVRDCSPYYHRASGYFYVAYTAGSTGANGYYSIARSKTPWLYGSWELVQNVNTSSVGSDKTWGPSIYETAAGDLYIIFSATNVVGGLVSDLKLYIHHPTTAGDLTSTMSAPVEVTVPWGTGTNEAKIFRSIWTGTEYMIAWDFSNNLVKVVHPTVAGVYTAWSATATLTDISVLREGPFVIERPNGAGFWVYTEYSTDHTVYKRLAYNASWVVDSATMEPIAEFPGAAYPNGPGLANGEVILIRNPAASLLLPPTPLGTMARQDDGKVAITGGTITLGAQFIAAGIDGGGTPWQDTGFRFQLTAGTYKSSIVLGGGGDDIYWRMPIGGVHFYNSDGATFVGEFSNTGFKVGAGTAITGIRHGVATLSGGTKVVSDTTITANTRIILTAQSLGTVAIATALAVTARSPGVSFTITSASATDTSVVGYMLIEP